MSLYYYLLELLIELDYNLSIIPIETTIKAILKDITDIINNVIRLEPTIRLLVLIDRSINGYSSVGVSILNRTIKLFSIILEYSTIF